MSTNNSLPGGFSVVTKIKHSDEVSKANDLAVVLRGAANLARLDQLMRITEGHGVSVSSDLRAGRNTNGQLRGQQLR